MKRRQVRRTPADRRRIKEANEAFFAYYRTLVRADERATDSRNEHTPDAGAPSKNTAHDGRKGSST